MSLVFLSKEFLVTANGLMLVFHTRATSTVSGLPAGPELKEEIYGDHSSTLSHLLFNLCQNCEDLKETMSCIPPSAFSAKHIRESQNKGKVANTSKTDQSNFKHFNNMAKDLNPLQYNSKMMNSVWGHYNRYSSHNVKTNNDVCFQLQHSQEVQQSAASSKNEVINLPNKMSLDKIWASFNFSQSH